MSESSASESTPARKAVKPKSAGFPDSSTVQSGGLSVPTIAALALAVIAIVLAIFGWFRPSTDHKYNGAQQDEAKSTICDAQRVVRQGTQINTNLQNPVPGDPAGELAVGANARLALSAGGAYLHQRLEQNPATPGDVASAVGTMADTLQQLSINYMAGHVPSDEVQQPLRDQLKSQISELDNLCAQ